MSPRYEGKPTRAGGLQLAGEGGLLQQLTKRLLESALKGELTDHLAYDRHDVAGRDGGNSRNGHRPKTVLTDVGPVQVDMPRDHDSSFKPKIVAKRQRRLAGVDELVISLSAKGLTTGEFLLVAAGPVVAAVEPGLAVVGITETGARRHPDLERDDLLRRWCRRPDTARRPRLARCSSSSASARNSSTSARGRPGPVRVATTPRSGRGCGSSGSSQCSSSRSRGGNVGCSRSAASAVPPSRSDRIASSSAR
jgi:hypothetical protein